MHDFLKLGYTHHYMLSHVGMKFWKTGKIIKVISESDYQKLQKSRGRSTDQQGPSRSLPVIVSDSYSDGPLIPLVRKKRKIFHVPTPPGSDTDSSQSLPNRAHTSIKVMFKEVAGMVQDIKKQLDNSMHVERGENALLKEIFTCLICKEISMESARPVVPPTVLYAVSTASVSGYAVHQFVLTAEAQYQSKIAFPSQH